MKFEIKQSLLKEAMETCKLTTSKENYRPVLMLIHVRVSQFGVADFYSCDGYRINKISVPCISNDNNESEFCFNMDYIKLDSVKKNEADYINIEVNDNEVTVSNHRYSTILKNDNTSKEYVQVKPFFEVDEFAFKIAVNPKYLKDLAESFKGDTYVELNFNKSTDAIIANNATNKKHLLLPVRIRG